MYKEVTDKVISAMETCVESDFQKPWITARNNSFPTNGITNNPYKGGNVINLWITEMIRGYADSTWATFKQWKEIGGQVRKGEKGTHCIFYSKVAAKDDPERVFNMAKSFVVFNIDQVDGAHSLTPEPITPKPFEQTQAAEDLILNSGAVIEKIPVDQACYIPGRDLIQMPSRDAFVPTNNRTREEGYYCVLFHEMGHWTGHKSRLDRLGDRTSVTDKERAMEELVAELSSIFTATRIGMSHVDCGATAAYVKSWLTLLKSDPKAIFKAAASAQKATDFIVNAAETNERKAA